MPQSPTVASILKNTGAYSIAMIAGKMASFFLLPVYTRYLTPTDYGIMELLDLTIFIFGTLVGLRFSESLFYFYAGNESPEARDRTVSTSFIGGILIAAFGGAAGYLGAVPLSRLVFGTPQYSPYFHVVFLAFVAGISTEVGFCFMRALDRSGSYAVASCVRLVIAVTSNVVLLVGFHKGISGVLWSSVVSSASMLLYMAVYIFSRVRFSFDWRLFVRQFRYAAPLGFSGLGMLFIHFGDRYFLRQYVTLANIGIYALAYKMGMMISYLQAPFDNYWRAQMYVIFRQPDGAKIYVRVCTYLTLSLTYTVVLMGLFMRPAFHFIAGPDFQPAADLAPWVAAAYVVRTIGAHFRSIFLIKGLTSKEAMVTWAGALACLAGYVGLIPVFRLWGAVAATGLGFGTMFVLSFWQAQKVHAFHFEYRRLFLATGCALAILAIHRLVAPATLWQQLSVGAVLALGYPLLLVLLRFFHADERNALKVALRRVTGAAVTHTVAAGK